MIINFSARQQRERLFYIIYILPIVTLFIIFRFFPIIEGFRLSVIELNPGGPDNFVGLNHYYKALQDKRFYYAVYHTIYFMLVYTIGSTIISLIVATAITSPAVKGKVFFKVCFFLPVVSSFVVVAVLWKMILSPSFGPIGSLLKIFNLNTFPFLEDKRIALNTIIGVSLWKHLGFYMVMYIANLQMIDQTLYDAALCDGATSWQQFRYISIPLLKPAFSLVIVLSIINGFQVFTAVLAMTGGGPGGSTEVILFYAYIKGFQMFEYGYGSAISIILFIIILLVTTVPRKLLKL